MMKMMMRPDKSQLVLPQYYRYENNATFNKAYQVMFGYQTFEAFLVGAAGGRSGTAVGRVISGKATKVGSSSGGGGGFLRVKAPLNQLTQFTSVIVGSRGANGADSGNGVRASAGSFGGPSSFAGFTANGGEGGVGGMYDVTTGGYATCLPGRGGNGGGNNGGRGSGGAGSLTAEAEGQSPGVQYAALGTAPTDGVANETPSGYYLAGGGGGGGGAGRVTIWDQNPVGGASSGAKGAAGVGGVPSTYDCPGFPSVFGADVGGPGGGVDVSDFIGSATPVYFGIPDSFAGAAAGIVFLKIT